MDNQIKAIDAFRPRVQLGRTAPKRDVVRFIARSTGLNEGDIAQVLAHLRDAVIFYTLDGRAVQLDGLGTYYPQIRLNGKLKVGPINTYANHRSAPQLTGDPGPEGRWLRRLMRVL